MSERFWVTLSIGGNCNEETHLALMELIEDDCPEDDPHVDDDGHLSAQFSEVNYAELDEIETFCRLHNLPYLKTVDGKSGFDSVRSWWFPGDSGGIDGFCLVDTEYKPLILIDVVRACLDNGGSVEDLLNATEPPELPKYVVG